MKSRDLKIIFIFLLWLTVFVPRVVAQCYLWYGDKWSGNSATYHINSGLGSPGVLNATQQDYETSIDSAVAQWNKAGADFQFIQGAEVSYDPNTEPDTIYQIGYYSIGNTDTLAVTNVSWDINNPFVITKVETYLNQYFSFSSHPSSDQVDIWTDVEHELGHWLNLQTETS